MKKLFNKRVVIGFGLLASLALTGCGESEKPVEVKPAETAVSTPQKTLKANDSKDMKVGPEYQTGWTQLENSIEVSLSGPEDCRPQIDRAVRNDKTVSIWLKDAGDDCSSQNVITFSTIEDAKDIEKVEVFEAGYDYSFELLKKE